MVSRVETPSSRLWRDWTASCAAGAVIGIGVAGAAAGLLASTVGGPFTRAESALVLAVMVVAGALEGLVLGSFQWRALREQLPSVRARSWIGATAVVAAFGWFLGMLPSTVFAPDTWASGPTLEPPFGATLALVLVFGLAVGSLFGAAQWIVLRRHARNARTWILANALGWSAGLPWIYLVASVPTVETPLALQIVLAVAAGAAGGLSMGAVTGAFLLKLSPIRVEGGVMLCREVMKTDVTRCMETLSVQACAEMMRDDNIGFLPVVDADKQVVGVITDRDLAVRVLADDLPADTPVGQVMTRQSALDRAIALSIDAGQLRADTDRLQMLFELHGLILALHHDARLLRLPGAVDRARVGFDRIVAHYLAAPPLPLKPLKPPQPPLPHLPSLPPLPPQLAGRKARGGSRAVSR